MSEFIAFRAAVELLKETGRQNVLDETYRSCIAELAKPAAEQVNCVKAIYEPFTDEEISTKIARMLSDGHIHAQVDLVYQTLEGMHEAIPGHPGDWYFSGDYPTPGGVALVNRAFVNYYEGNPEQR